MLDGADTRRGLPHIFYRRTLPLHGAVRYPHAVNNGYLYVHLGVNAYRAHAAPHLMRRERRDVRAQAYTFLPMTRTWHNVNAFTLYDAATYQPGLCLSALMPTCPRRRRRRKNLVRSSTTDAGSGVDMVDGQRHGSTVDLASGRGRADGLLVPGRHTENSAETRLTTLARARGAAAAFRTHFWTLALPPVTTLPLLKMREPQGAEQTAGIVF